MNRESWMEKCRNWKEKWPVVQEQSSKLNDDSDGINLYKFIEVLNQNLKDDSVVTWDSGSSAYVVNQALELNSPNQRSIGPFAQGGMGCALSISAGVSLAKNKGEVICCLGDGSFNTNPQSLAVIKKHNLPVKIFVWNNNGYMSIKNSQDKFYEGRRIGTCSDDGIFFPKIEDIAKTYKIRYNFISLIVNLDIEIKKTLNTDGPIITEVMCQELHDIAPSITTFKNEKGQNEQHDFSNMHPFIKNIENEKIK